MLRFYKLYFLWAVFLFGAEVFIGLCMHDDLIRPYGGDFLVVILLYCMVRSFFNSPILATAVGVLLFAYLGEISQYFHLVTLLGLQHSTTAKLLLGTSFSFIDLLTYTLGILLVIIIENLRLSLKNF